MGFIDKSAQRLKPWSGLKRNQDKKITSVTRYDMFWFKTTLKQRFETLQKDLGEHFCFRS